MGFEGHFSRAGGILLHPTSLPGPHGIGDLGPQAHAFIDWLRGAGCRIWQVLPLGPTGYGNSPYQAHSVFAGNPNLISLELLVRDGLLTASDLLHGPKRVALHRRHAARVDYARIIPRKMNLLQRAYRNFEKSHLPEMQQEFRQFRSEAASWLDDFSLFMAIKESLGDTSWLRWPEVLRMREASALQTARRALGSAAERHAFYQFLFFRQWMAVRQHAHHSGIQIIGDVPIFAAEDSADVWSNPALFCLDDNRMPTAWSGVPPDYFSPTGQLWGNPLYRWEEHKVDRYSWWRRRLKATFEIVDIARLDHFRGFEACWSTPAGSATAENGMWSPGPADDFFEALQDDFHDPLSNEGLPLVAEDLGEITPEVVRLRDRYRLPGMKVLQFGFSHPANPFLPHNYPQHCVAYTGTHDNDTSRGWLSHASSADSSFARRYLVTPARSFSWGMIRAIWSSVAALAIAPMQDVLDLGTNGRMNYPGRLDGNWEWRMRDGDLAVATADRLRDFNTVYGR